MREYLVAVYTILEREMSARLRELCALHESGEDIPEARLLDGYTPELQAILEEDGWQQENKVWRAIILTSEDRRIAFAVSTVPLVGNEWTGTIGFYDEWPSDWSLEQCQQELIRLKLDVDLKDTKSYYGRPAIFMYYNMVNIYAQAINDLIEDVPHTGEIRQFIKMIGTDKLVRGGTGRQGQLGTKLAEAIQL
jgi:hypothetical protein